MLDALPAATLFIFSSMKTMSFTFVKAGLYATGSYIENILFKEMSQLWRTFAKLLLLAIFRLAPQYIILVGRSISHPHNQSPGSKFPINLS